MKETVGTVHTADNTTDLHRMGITISANIYSPLHLFTCLPNPRNKAKSRPIMGFVRSVI